MAELELIDQVNSDNEFITPVVRSVAHEKGLWHRSVHIWVYSPQGNILIQRRSIEKSDAPGKLDMAIGGHFKSGQNELEAAVGEASEELGVNLVQSQLGQPTIYKYDRGSDQMPEPHRQFVYVYFISLAEDTLFSFNDGEVSEVIWVPFRKIANILNEKDFRADFAYHTDEYLELVINKLGTHIG